MKRGSMMPAVRRLFGLHVVRSGKIEPTSGRAVLPRFPMLGLAAELATCTRASPAKKPGMNAARRGNVVKRIERH